ncbi:MAG: polysaccharide biosynthesis tyrosine autokinase [Parafilimonas sp.]|nr:polysaccharide biosynthesis tyrosine autokinase [Parafilimonas sp.]
MQDLNNNELTTTNVKQQDVDIKFIVAKVLGNWYWYVVSLVLFAIVGVLLELFVSPHYTVTGRVLVAGYNAQGKSITGTDESTVLSQLGNMFSVPNSVNNEMEIIHSRTLVERTVRDLQLNVTYWGQGPIRYDETYKASPFFIKELSLKNITDPIEYDVRVVDGGNKVHFEDEDSDSSFTLSFGDTIHTWYGSWVLERNPDVTEKNPKHALGMIINSYAATIYNYMENITAATTNEYVNIIDLSIGGITPEKNEDILKHLIGLYIQSDIEDHNRVADSTIAFIDSRLIGVSEDLSTVDKNIESFKKTNKLTDLTNDANELLQTSTTVNQSMADKQVQYRVVDDLEKYLEDEHNNTRVMPTTAPIQDPAFVQTLDKYNSLELQRQTYLQTSTEENPNVKSLDIQLSQLRGDLLSMMRTYKKGLNTEQSDLESRNAQMQGSIQKVPTQQRIFLDFTRRQNVLEGLYTYLLQTREQTAISKTNSIMPIRVIDEPIRAPLPYFPNIIIIVIGIIFLTLLVPSVWIFMRELLNRRVITTDDINNFTNVPVVAGISHTKGKQRLIAKDSNTEIAEQFRTLRTNLNFLIPDANEKVIMTTSSMGGEGKSFIAMNLAYVLALSGKRTVLMEMDLRKPKISSALHIDNVNGFSDYIVSDMKTKDLVKQTNLDPNLYIINSGTIPPNPAELLTREKVAQLFAQLRNEFDYIVIDSPAVGLVADSLLLGKYADMVLYVVRQRITFKKQINIVQGLANERKFKRLDVIFNDIKSLPGYGYGYGYQHGSGYYSTDRRPFFKRIFSKRSTI